jgi:hypothetical protein
MQLPLGLHLIQVCALAAPILAVLPGVVRPETEVGQVNTLKSLHLVVVTHHRSSGGAGLRHR